MKVNAENIVKAVEYANALREEFGVELIEDLPEGIPGQTTECVLARAFNFNCKVDGMGHNWWVKFSFNNKSEAEKLASILNTETEETFPFIKVGLPYEIAKIAIDFDYGKLPEYVESYSMEKTND